MGTARALVAAVSAIWLASCGSNYSCGDGHLDPGENCDSQIPAGSVGACPSSCDD